MFSGETIENIRTLFKPSLIGSGMGAMRKGEAVRCLAGYREGTMDGGPLPWHTFQPDLPAM
jgi:hypothetical protein